MNDNELVSIPGAAKIIGTTPTDLAASISTIPVEGWADTTPLWRVDTLNRWGKLGFPADLPISPTLTVYTLNQLAEKLGVGPDWVRKHVHTGRLQPTWRVDTMATVAGRPMLLWSQDDVEALLPDCPGGHKVDIARIDAGAGRRTRLLCSCREAAWVELRVP